MHNRDIEQWVDEEFESMLSLLIAWANINTFSFNSQGLDNLASLLINAFSKLHPDHIDIIPYPHGPGIHLSKRPKNTFRIYLGGHYDTVFSPKNPFLKVSWDGNLLHGPGVTDMKGGLIVLLKSLEIFEMSPFASGFGWEVFLNPDEEIGSPHSTPKIREIGKKCAFGLLFEPALRPGLLACERMGSANYKASTRGVSAHIGRDPAKGKNAIYPLARWITQVEQLHHPNNGILLNVGKIEGGVASNKTPDSAMCLVNLRAENEDKMQQAHNSLMQSAKENHVQLKVLSKRSPKPFDTSTKRFFWMLNETARQLNFILKWKKTGGVCDGNTLAEIGVPTIDSLGVWGDGVHTEKEWMDPVSLKKQILLVSHFLIDLAKYGES